MHNSPIDRVSFFLVCGCKCDGGFRSEQESRLVEAHNLSDRGVLADVQMEPTAKELCARGYSRCVQREREVGLERMEDTVPLLSQ